MLLQLISRKCLIPRHSVEKREIFSQRKKFLAFFIYLNRFSTYHFPHFRCSNFHMWQMCQSLQKHECLKKTCVSNAWGWQKISMWQLWKSIWKSDWFETSPTVYSRRIEKLHMWQMQQSFWFAKYIENSYYDCAWRNQKFSLWQVWQGICNFE